MGKNERNSNIEFLRILAIMGIIVLHYNNPVIGGGLEHVIDGSVNMYILYFFESLYVCGVNLFVLISGYFLCESNKRNIWKPIELIVQVMIVRETIYFIRVILGKAPLSFKTIVTTLLPTNYFVILYCAIYIFSPYINVTIEKLPQKAFRELVVLSICFFAIYPTIIDVLGELRHSEFVGLSSIGMYGSQWGYTIVNFYMMYLIGAYIKKGNSRVRGWSTKKLVVGVLVCVGLMMIWARVNDRIGFFTERSAWEYCNPLVVAEAVFAFCFFEKMNLGTNVVINKVAEGVFTVFLLHQIFIPYLYIQKFVTGNPIIMIIHMILCQIIVYGICWAVHISYHLIVDPVFKTLCIKIKIPAFTVNMEKDN